MSKRAKGTILGFLLGGIAGILIQDWLGSGLAFWMTMPPVCLFVGAFIVPPIMDWFIPE